MEVLVSIAILGVAITALLGALVTTITSASEHRSLASIDTVIRSYAEQLKYEVELQPNGNSWFTQCASVTPSTYAGNMFNPPVNQAGYTASITGIQYWNKATNVFDSVSPSTCNSNLNEQSGFQLVTVQVTAPNGVVESLSMGVRMP